MLFYFKRFISIMKQALDIRELHVLKRHLQNGKYINTKSGKSNKNYNKMI